MGRWNLFAVFLVASAGQLLTEEVDFHGGFSMIQRQQRQVLVESRPKPWDVHCYVLANFHKAGVHLTAGIFFSIFAALGVPPTSVGNVVYPCSLVNTCFNSDAPVRQMTDSYDASYAQKERKQKNRAPLYTAISVRDPLVMVASAYCYHGDGHEPLNKLVPEKELHGLGFADGAQFTADRILPLIQDIVGSLDDPANHTHVLSFERLTESSESFDKEVQDFMDFMFPDDLITEDERQQALKAATAFDARRNPSATEMGHSNSKDCERKALAAILQMKPGMLRTLHELRAKLGYNGSPSIH